MRNFSTSRCTAILLSSVERFLKSSKWNDASKTLPRYRLLNMYELTWWRHRTQTKRRTGLSRCSRWKACKANWAKLSNTEKSPNLSLLLLARNSQSLVCYLFPMLKVSWTNNKCIIIRQNAWNYLSWTSLNKPWTKLRPNLLFIYNA